MKTRLFHKGISPIRVLPLGYLGVICVGTLLLMLPAASYDAPLPFLDALFTATSASCVTGLVVVDTGTYFTPFGQAVVLLLIQVGGLGFMAVTTMLFLALRGPGIPPGAYAAGGRHRLWANSRGCPFKPTHCGPYHGLRKHWRPAAIHPVCPALWLGKRDLVCGIP